MILVTGAGGKTGRAVLAALARRGAAARAMVRGPRRRDGVRTLAAEVCEGDLLDPRAVAAAVAGAEAIYHICPNVHPDEVAIGRGVIAAARTAGVGRLVFHSVLHPRIEAMPHHWAKLRVEELLVASGLDFTILQPAAYMQNLLAQWDAVVRRGVYAVPYDLDARVALVDLGDVAEAAARVLTEPGHEAATYELCAPGLPDQRQIAAILGDTLGREVRAVETPLDEWAARAREAGLHGYALEALLRMFRYYGRHGMAGGPRALEWLLGRPATALRRFVERVARDEPHGLGRA
ncbi:MAG: NmrA family NAD(P)-binding protein [Thermoanaerobaculia bacterium]|nr:NmrA family NAD(P)-binding protein [Thermoanaerobaculia bacterium]